MAKQNIKVSVLVGKDGRTRSTEQYTQKNPTKPVTAPERTTLPGGSSINLLRYDGPEVLDPTILEGNHMIKVKVVDQYASLEGSIAKTGTFQSPYPEGWQHLGVAETFMRVRVLPDPQNAGDSITVDDFDSFADRFGNLDWEETR